MNTKTQITGVVGALVAVAAGVSIYAATSGNDNKSRQNAIGSLRVSYPDIDALHLATTVGYLGDKTATAHTSSASYINWRSSRVYDQKFTLTATSQLGYCMGAWTKATTTTGATLPLVKIGDACVGSNSYGYFKLATTITAPSGVTFKSLQITVCTESADRTKTSACVSQFVAPGLD